MVLGLSSAVGLGGLFGEMLGLGGMLAGVGETDYEEPYEEAIRLLASVEQPEFDYRNIPPAQLQRTGQLTPQTYAPDIRGEPALMEGSPEMRDAQIQAMQQMAQYAGTDLPMDARLATADIQRAMGQEQQGLTQAAIEAMAAQGRLGGGQEATLRGLGNQQGMELARGMGSDLMRQQIAARMGAIGQTGQMAGGIRQQDLAQQAQNVSALNRFNEWVSQLSTGAQAAGAGARERTQAGNVGEQQRLADYNRQNMERMALMNQAKSNELLQQQFGNQMGQAQAQANVMQGLGGALRSQQIADQTHMTRLSGTGGQALGGLVGWLGGAKGEMFPTKKKE